MISVADSGQGEKFLFCGYAEPATLRGLHLGKPGIAQALAKRGGRRVGTAGLRTPASPEAGTARGPPGIDRG